MAFILPSVIARESLMILSNNLVIASQVFKGDTSSFTSGKVGDTITIRKPADFVVNEFTSTISTQTVNETSTALVLEKHFDVSVELTTKQLTLELNDFAEQIVRPAMVRMAEKIDSYLHSKYVEVNNIVGDGTLSTLGDLAAIDRKLMEMQVPLSGRVGIVGPVTKERFLSIDRLNGMDTRGAAGLSALQEAAMGRVMGIQWYGAQGVPQHVAGVPGGTPAGTASAGATTVAVASGGASGTYKKGDIITFANHSTQYVITADVTLNGSGAGNITIYPALTTAVSSQAITLVATHYANLAGNFRGISMASVPLELPMDATSARAGQMSGAGMNIRVVYDYDISTKKNIISFDLLCGAKVTDPRLLTRYNG